MNMRGLILAAGKGSRINDLTSGLIPKSLLKLGDTTLLGHSLHSFKTLGINSIIVVTGYRRKMIEEYVREFWDGDVVFVFNPHYDETNVIYSFWLGMQQLRGHDFVFLHADTVFSDEILSKVLDLKNNAHIVLALDRHACGDEEMKIILDNDGGVEFISKNLDNSIVDGEFLGLAAISSKIYDILIELVNETLEKKFFDVYFEHCLQQIIDRNITKIICCDVSGMPWREVDFKEDYDAAVKLFG